MVGLHILQIMHNVKGNVMVVVGLGTDYVLASETLRSVQSRITMHVCVSKYVCHFCPLNFSARGGVLSDSYNV